MDICETLEDWTTDLSFISDSDEDDDVLLVRSSYTQQNHHSVCWCHRFVKCLNVFQVPGKYRALVDHLKCGKDEVIIKHGDIIQLLQENTEGLW